jgi:phytoene dehydrogenase-like protein
MNDLARPQRFSKCPQNENAGGTMATGVPVNRISTDQQQPSTESQQAATTSQQTAAACATAAGSAAKAAVEVNSTATAARMSFFMISPSGMK